MRGIQSTRYWDALMINPPLGHVLIEKSVIGMDLRYPFKGTGTDFVTFLYGQPELLRPCKYNGKYCHGDEVFVVLMMQEVYSINH